jgi:6-pyruvoyl-tetrahydropterin synthase related domain
MDEQRNSGSHLDALTLGAIAAAAIAVVVPFLWLGIPSGHDFEFHLNSWIEVVGHWRQGVLYPHWAALAHYGYGEARFVFYPPISWTLGALLGIFLPWPLVPAAFIWIVLMLAGVSMFVLARRWLNRWNAIFVAVLYVVNPYDLVIVYWRSALAELAAAALLPLLFLWALRSDEESARAVPPLALLLAAGWLTNVPSAVMMNYALASLAIYVALKQHTLKPLANAAVAVIAGAALAAIYLLPVLHQQSWANLAQVLSPGVRPGDNFLFTSTNDTDHNHFNFLISLVAVWQIAFLALAFALWRRKNHRILRWPLLTWGAVTTLLMVKITSPLWTYSPELRYVQFPWRWLLCLNVPFALVLGIVFRRWASRVMIFAVVLAAVPLLSHFVLPPWWDTSADIREMVDNQHDGIGNEGVEEYVPAGADAYDLDQNAPPAHFDGSGTTRIEIDRWAAEDRVITADSTAKGALILRLFNYPSWHVKVNGIATPSTTSPHGELRVPITAGEDRIEVRFVEGWDRTAGIIISFLTLLLLAAWHALYTKSIPPFMKTAS